VRIVNPFLKTAGDGMTLIRIDESNELIRINKNVEEYLIAFKNVMRKCDPEV